MKRPVIDDIRRILTLFAGFVVGMHLAVLLHELGHAIGYWLDGGHVSAFWMEAPLPAGHVAGSSPHRVMPVWGGVAFGSLITVLPLLIARALPPRSTIRFAALMAAAFCLGHNGMYLFVGSIVPFADALNMIALGAPRWLLLLLGIPLLAGFVLVLTCAVKCVGIPPSASVVKWIFEVEAGLLSFLAVMVVAMLFMPVPTEVRVPTIMFVGCYALGYALVAFRVRSEALLRQPDLVDLQLPQRWSTTYQLMVAAILLIAVESLALKRV